VSERAFQRCVHPDCATTYDLGEVLFACRKCGSLLDIAYDWSRCEVPESLSFFASRWATPGRTAAARADYSGVWRFRELLPFAELDDLVTLGEGRTTLQQADALAAQIGLKPNRLFLQYEGFNPSGSFKDNGMAAAFTAARRLNRRRVACASTGNTSASMALYARHTPARSGDPVQAVVFVGGDKIAFGKLAQALDYGATTLQIDGDFDACMKLVQQAADRLDIYLMNSVNPFRLEGQKTIMYRVLEGLDWQAPDWIVVPGGNLGNSSAFGKAFIELRELGLIERVPRLAIINAAGANTLCELVNEHNICWNAGRIDRTAIDAHLAHRAAEGRSAKTVASAIEIGKPVNLSKALRSLDAMNGVVRQVTDEQILDGKALIGAFGFGCEPASGASVAGLRLLFEEGVIAPTDRVACILTGHGLKDPDATVSYHRGSRGGTSAARFTNPPIRCPADLDAVADLLARHGAKN
jgi:threonine synthase